MGPTLTPVHQTFVAEVGGIDLSRRLDGATVADLRKAFADNSILVFHGQTLDDDEHVAFSRHFGDLQGHTVSEWLLPSHGPAFRKRDALLQQTIDRLDGYLHMADFGTCAIDWPLMDEWEQELADGKRPE